MTVKSIAFDLDDTLLDTSQLLVPLAAKKACEAIVAAGLVCDVNSCLQWRAMKAAELSHKEIFAGFIAQFPSEHSDQALQAALKAFYNPVIPERLPLIEGAEENLRQLSQKYTLYLITSGEPTTQKRKIEALQIAPYFRKIYLVDTFRNETKQSAFEDILRLENIAPEELLSIGNRLSQEIRDAKRCGAKTCYFCHGEHVGERPAVREDYPDFTIYKHTELVKVCGL